MSLEFTGFDSPKMRPQILVLSPMFHTIASGVCSSKTLAFSGLRMANVALEVAAAAFGKVKRIKETYFKKAGIGQNGCFPTARMAVFPQRGACCTLRHCLLRGAKNGTASQRGACCTIFCGRRSTRARIHCFSTVLSVLYLTLCGRRS